MRTVKAFAQNPKWTTLGDAAPYAVCKLPAAIPRMEVMMFDSLDEQMRKDEDRTSTSKGRRMRYGLYALVGVAVIGALIYAVRLIG